MMIQQTFDKLYAMKLHGMADSLKEQIASPNISEPSFQNRVSLIVDRQWDLKESRGLRRRLQVAKLRQQAAAEDIDFRTHRGLDRAATLSLGECSFISSHSNIITSLLVVTSRTIPARFVWVHSRRFLSNGSSFVASMGRIRRVAAVNRHRKMTHHRRRVLPHLSGSFWHRVSGFYPPAIVAGFYDFAVVGDPVQQCGCHL